MEKKIRTIFIGGEPPLTLWEKMSLKKGPFLCGGYFSPKEIKEVEYRKILFPRDYEGCLKIFLELVREYDLIIAGEVLPAQFVECMLAFRSNPACYMWDDLVAEKKAAGRETDFAMMVNNSNGDFVRWAFC